MKYKDTIDLYDDEGKLLKSGVTLDKISPLVNKGALNVIDLTKRTVAVNFAGIEEALKTGKMGGKSNQILGRSMNCSVVKDCDALSAKIKEMVQVTDGDNTKITKVGGGKMILVEVPSARLNAAATYDAASTAVAAATTYALVDQYKVGMFDGSYVKGAVWGTYPQTMHMDGGNVVSILNIPQNNEGLGYALRNIPANHAAMMTHRNAMQGAALCATFEQAGEFEMGMAIGPFERAQLLLYAYQGLNANNLVYDLVKANGKTGTIGTVVQSLVERAIEDKVIKAGKKGKSGYIFYDTKDPMMWNAYASAGTLAATMVNCGAGRFAQAVSATLLYFNDLLEHETGLPGSDFGRTMGVAVGFSFFSHSIYGGGGPGGFNGNHVVTRHAAGVGMPCIVAACCLDAGTQMFGPEAHVEDLRRNLRAARRIQQADPGNCKGHLSPPRTKMTEATFPQCRIVTERLLNPETTERLLNQICSVAGVRRMVLNGPRLPATVTYGPAKGLANPHTMRKMIHVGDQELELQVHVGTILLELENRDIIPALQTACKPIFTDYSFYIQEGQVHENRTITYRLL